MPNTDVIEKWVTALESGEYAQTEGRLHRAVPHKGPYMDEKPAGFCCLGVLCDLAVKAGVIPEPTLLQDHNGDETYAYGTHVDEASSFPPPAVVEWAGLNSNNPVLDWMYTDAAGRVTVDQVEASQLNDSNGLDFTDIAAAVQRTFLPKADRK